jgi:hypothetical protein
MNELSIQNQKQLPAVGGFAFHSMQEIESFAILMSKASIAIPKHLRDNPGACMAIAIQASEWQMSPFSVANKSYSVNDRLAYEAQLVNAVILRRAPIVGRFTVDYSGSGATRRCTVSVKAEDGETLEYTSPEFGQITVKNSPLWKSDPDQQLFYFSSRSLCRRHFPDVLLGIYTMDEMQFEDEPRDATPKSKFARELAEKTVETVASVEIVEPETAPETPLDIIKAKLEESGMTVAEALASLQTLGIGNGRTSFSKMDAATLEHIAADWSNVVRVFEELKSAGGEA